MEVTKPYVFYDEDGNLWEAEFASCNKIPNPTEMWNGTAVIIKTNNNAKEETGESRTD